MKKETLKKALVFGLTFLLCALPACEQTTPDGEMVEIGMEGMPDYSADIDTKIFTIGQWVNVPNQYSWLDTETNKIVYGEYLTDEEYALQYRYVKESGINLASIPSGAITNEWCVKLLENAEEQGIKQLVWDGALRNLLMNENITDAVAIERAEELVANYKDSPALAGHSFDDEPTIDELDGLALAYKRYKYLFPDKIFYINLFPVIVSTEVLGGSYEEYVRKAAKLLPEAFISYDHYPLYGDGKATSVIDNFLLNMELIHDYKGEEQEIWTFLQSGNSAGTRSPETYADIAWQVNSFLAFGGRGIQWFCYWEVPSERFNGMINGQGEREPIYYVVQEVNNEVLAFDHIYLNYDWQGVLTYEGSESKDENANFANLLTSLLDGHERVASVETEQDLLVGAFKDGEQDGFMVVNFADPGKALSSKIEIEFNDCTKVMVSRRCETKAYSVTNGVFSTELEAGEGCFIIPVA